MIKSKLNIYHLVRHLRREGMLMLLESQMKDHQSGRETFLAAKAESWISAEGNTIRLFEEGKETTFTGNPLEFLKEYKRRNDWVFGYLGYDLKNAIEDLRSENPHLIQAPDLFFFSPTFLLRKGADEEISILKGELPDGFEHADEMTPQKTEHGLDHDQHAEKKSINLILKKHIPREDYLKVVKKVQEDIYEGEYYELNLTHALEFDFTGDSLLLFEQMKKLNPVPFAAYLHTDEMDVCCASPERFLAKKGRRVWSQPIKGTAEISGNAAEDIRHLSASEKEKAENLMIVDLVRNDLNRIAKTDSVQVKDLFEIQSFEMVHQMVSTVECTVPDDADAVDIIKACFPMGSMTGAPKIAVMKAIEKYECYRRSMYSGAIGYMDPKGDFDFNVVIRSALIKKNTLIYPVGGAITGDSIPEKEWDETWLKAKIITSLITE